MTTTSSDPKSSFLLTQMPLSLSNFFFLSNQMFSFSLVSLYVVCVLLNMASRLAKKFVHWSYKPTNQKTPSGAPRAALWPPLPPSFLICVSLYGCVCICVQGVFNIWSLSCVFLWVHSHALWNLFSAPFLQTPLLLFPKAAVSCSSKAESWPSVHECTWAVQYVKGLVCRLKWSWILVTENLISSLMIKCN